MEHYMDSVTIMKLVQLENTAKNMKDSHGAEMKQVNLIDNLETMSGGRHRSCMAASKPMLMSNTLYCGHCHLSSNSF